MILSTRHQYIALGIFCKIGPRTLEKALSVFGSIDGFYSAPPTKLIPVLGEKLSRELITFRNSCDIKKRVEEFARHKISIIVRDDPEMPETLRNIPDPPLCLFIRGDVSLLKTSIIGIVGTRKVSSYGRQITTFFGSHLAASGMTIASGMALGVDTIAHQSALDAKGKTIAVLGSGIDIIYPAGNRLLYQRILDSGGLIVSEYPPGYMPKQFTFVLRNRIISGLSRGVLVVEGSLNSGSMITAKYAVEQGKDVFAIPMPLLSSGSAGPNSLLKQGAKLVLHPDDILAEYGEVRQNYLQTITNDLSEEELMIYSLLHAENHSIQMLLNKTKMQIHLLLPVLSNMEINGIIKKNREGKYEVIQNQFVLSV